MLRICSLVLVLAFILWIKNENLLINSENASIQVQYLILAFWLVNHQIGKTYKKQKNKNGSFFVDLSSPHLTSPLTPQMIISN